MEFLIICGYSGAGKTTTLRTLEDIDYYCVDNLPPVLIETFYDLCKNSSEERLKKVAVVTNVRTNAELIELSNALIKLQHVKKDFKILFLDAKTDTIIKRYKETRKKHPLILDEKTLTQDAVKIEKELLRKCRHHANYIIDTTFLSSSQLKDRVKTLFMGDKQTTLTVTCMSFGFKYGSPDEADLIFDVRCLTNPFYVEELKYKTGLDDSVREYVMKWDATQGLIKRIKDYMDFAIPLYKEEGKSQLVVAFGCTGGKHRSVALSQDMYNYLIDNGQSASIHHRDIRKA